MKKMILTNILTLVLSSAIAQDVSISLNVIKDIQLSNGDVITAKEALESDGLTIDQEKLLVTPNSPIRDVQLNDGSLIKFQNNQVDRVMMGGDMGGGR